MIGVDQLTDEEMRSFRKATQALRAALPEFGFLHTELKRNPTGVLSGVKAYDREGGRFLADVAIRADGEPAPVRRWQT